MKALKIVGIVFGILLLLTGGGLAAASVLANKGQAAFQEELTSSGYAGPVDGTVQSVSQNDPVVVTVSYTDDQGKQQTGQGTFAGGQPPQVGDTVSTYYSTSDPSQVVVVNLPGLGDLSAIADTLRTAAIICLIVGSVLLLAGNSRVGAGQEAAGSCSTRTDASHWPAAAAARRISAPALSAAAAAGPAVSAAAAAGPAVSAAAAAGPAVSTAAAAGPAVSAAAAAGPAVSASAAAGPAVSASAVPA